MLALVLDDVACAHDGRCDCSSRILGSLNGVSDEMDEAVDDCLYLSWERLEAHGAAQMVSTSQNLTNECRSRVKCCSPLQTLTASVVVHLTFAGMFVG